MPTGAEAEEQVLARVLELIEQRDDAALRRVVEDVHPADLAELLDGLTEDEDRLRLFRLLDPETASETIREVNEQTRAVLVEQLSDARVTAVIERLDTDDAADLLADVPPERQQEILERASPEARRDIGDLLTYAEDSAGGIMKTEVATVTQDFTVAQTVDYLRRNADDFHDVHNVFVTDDQRRLIGVVPLRHLLLVDASLPMRLIMDVDVVAVGVDVDQEEVARLFEKYDLLSVPVTDAHNRLVGRITVDDIVDVIAEEATEDMLKLAGVTAEMVGPATPLQAMRARLPWLLLNLVTATISASAVALFENTIRSAAIAAALMTIVASQGGNAGVQTMTLGVRGLALGELHASHAWRLLGQECLAALANGSVLGIVAGGLVYLWRGDPTLSAVLAVAMIANFLVAAVVGSLVPLGLKTLRVDPAVSSAVFVTAATDMLGFIVFLGLLTLAI